MGTKWEYNKTKTDFAERCKKEDCNGVVTCIIVEGMWVVN